MTAKWKAGTTYVPGSLVQPATKAPTTVTPPQNPGFETGDLTGWTPSDPARWAVLQSIPFNGGNPYSGSYFAQATGSGLTSMVNNERVAIKPGQRVTVSAMGKITNHGTDDAGFQVVLNWYDADGNALPSYVPGNLITGKGGYWKPSSASGLAPADAATFAISLSVSNGTHGSTVEWDAASYNYAITAPPLGLIFKATQAAPGKSGASEPTWPLTTGVEVTDNEVVWEGVLATRLVWKASPLLKSGSGEPDWPTTVGGVVHDGNIDWVAASLQITDPNCPHSKIVAIAAGKVYAADDDIIKYCATVNPRDWTTTNDAGFLPFGLNTYGANPVAALGLYRSNLVAFNAEGFQMWQVDTDPANTTLLDALPIASTQHKALAPVANDLLFLSSQGVRSVGIAASSTNLQAGDVGMPIDVLVKAALTGMEQDGTPPISTYFPAAGQYWLAFPPNRPVLSGTMPDTCVDAIYSHNLTIYGGVAPYSAPAVYQGDTPAGMTLAIAGTTLTVAFANGAKGDYDFFLTVTDASGRVSLPFECKFRVHDYQIVGTLPDTTTDQAYSHDLVLDDGLAPFEDPVVTSGALPDGATLTINDDGTLTVAWPALTPVGVYTFELAVTDATGCTATYAAEVAIDLQGAQLSDWRYLQIDAADATDYSATAFDDSAWAVGVAPFGSWEDGRTGGLPAATAYDPRFATAFGTAWATNTRLWLRRTLTLGAVPAEPLRVTCFIEDHCQFYINGTLVITTPSDYDGGTGQQFTIAPDALVVGDNIIAIRCDDEAPTAGVSVVYADFIVDAT